MDQAAEQLSTDPLEAPGAGARVIRGGSTRVVGYALGALLYLATAPFLIRYLGVERLGGYLSVLALIGVVALMSDAGLTLVGVREYALREREARRRLLDNLLALRAVVVALGVAVACGFAALAGYSGDLVIGTALAGVGLLLVVVQQTYGVALVSELRNGTVTAFEVGRQALTSFGLLALIMAGAGVSVLLAVSIPVGAIIALILLRREPVVRPRVHRDEARYLVREAIPVAVASSIGSLFYRSAIVVMSITATTAQTSYFGAAYRILESVMAIPSLLCATAFPILARAAAGEGQRTAFALRRLAEVGLIIGAGVGLTLALAARPAILVLAGPDFEESIGVLRIQAAALPATFLVSTWATGLWAVRGHRELAIANVIGVTVAITLAATAGPTVGARGVAVAMLAAEYLLAALYFRALMRLRPGFGPNTGLVAKVIAASAVAATAALLPVPDLVRAGCGALTFVVILLATRAVPPEVWRAFADGWPARRRPRAPVGDET